VYGEVACGYHVKVGIDGIMVDDDDGKRPWGEYGCVEHGRGG
jgi:hypothetical protein